MPASPESSHAATPIRLEVASSFDRLTHYLFRYPAKFHPPVVQALLERYSAEGDTVLDPFCGSGTLLVGAAALGRNSRGLDIDPLAVAIASAKVQRLDPASFAKSSKAVLQLALPHRRTPEAYEHLQHEGLTLTQYERQVAKVMHWVPAIPNLMHWFRSYVVVDLAHIRRAISEAQIPETHRRYISIVFASIIRNSSNADPVPVSGLEVTKWMKARDAEGRVVDPFGLFQTAMAKAAESARSFRESSDPNVEARAGTADATKLHTLRPIAADTVITSPPYHSAVDYYRRHQLEMFWLGLTVSQAERLDLLQKYVGRPHVPQRHPWVGAPLGTALAKEWEARIREVSPSRADAFRHYLTAMTSFFEGLAHHLPVDAPAAIVVGHSGWGGTQIPTTQLFNEISGDLFEMDEVLNYPVKNRYMSYSRHNDADIAEEFVLVLRRTGAKPMRLRMK